MDSNHKSRDGSNEWTDTIRMDPWDVVQVTRTENQREGLEFLRQITLHGVGSADNYAAANCNPDGFALFECVNAKAVLPAGTTIELISPLKYGGTTIEESVAAPRYRTCMIEGVCHETLNIGSAQTHMPEEIYDYEMREGNPTLAGYDEAYRGWAWFFTGAGAADHTGNHVGGFQYTSGIVDYPVLFWIDSTNGMLKMRVEVPAGKFGWAFAFHIQFGPQWVP